MTTAKPTIKWLMTLALITTSAALAAQQNDTDSADRAQLRAEIQEARTQMAEAARRMARLQRQLGGEERQVEIMRFIDGESNGSAPDAPAWLGDSGEFVLRKLPPRLGVLLGGPGSDASNQVIGLTPGGGAEAAGIEQGDRLVSVNDKSVAEGDPQSVRDALEGIEAGTSVPVIVERGGQQLTFDVETTSVVRDVRVFGLRSAPDTGEFEREVEREIEREIVIMRPDRPMPPVPPRHLRAPLFSVLGHDSDLINNHAGLEPYFGTAEGVIVLRIDPENTFGLRDGDVVLRLDDETVDRPVDLGRLLLVRDPGDEVVIEVMRENVLTQIPATIPDRSKAIHRFPMRFEFESAAPPPDAPNPPQPL